MAAAGRGGLAVGGVARIRAWRGGAGLMVSERFQWGVVGWD